MISIVPRPVSVVEKPGRFAFAASGVVKARIDPASLPPEGYRLSVTKDGVGIVAGGEAGEFHARTTLRQLVPAAALTAAARGTPAGAKTWPVPCVEIVDQLPTNASGKVMKFVLRERAAESGGRR